MSNPLLEIDSVTKRFGGLLALDRVNLTIPRGSILGLIGPNGAGKTTLFNCISGVIVPEQGAFRFGSTGAPVNLVGLAPHEVARVGISRTFQNIRLFSGLTVLENVLTGTHVRTHAGWWEAVWPWSRQVLQEDGWALDRAAGLLDKVGLTSYAGDAPGALSYGQQRRLELARALASEPDLLLLDEPAAGLNYEERQELIVFLKELRAGGMTILLIEHDMRVVMPICDRVAVLDEGRKIAEGSPREIQESAAVIEAYLGADA